MLQICHLGGTSDIALGPTESTTDGALRMCVRQGWLLADYFDAGIGELRCTSSPAIGQSDGEASTNSFATVPDAGMTWPTLLVLGQSLAAQGVRDGDVLQLTISAASPLMPSSPVRTSHQLPAQQALQKQMTTESNAESSAAAAPPGVKIVPLHAPARATHTALHAVVKPMAPAPIVPQPPLTATPKGSNLIAGGNRLPNSKPLLVLDLDGTLVDARQQRFDPAQSPQRRMKPPDVKSLKGHGHAVRMRPGLGQFLQGCTAAFDLAVWSAAPLS
jgi:hypothetical protein